MLFVTLPARAAEAYPSKPVRILVGTPPGSGSDVMMRIAAVRLGERWNRSVVIDNRAGALGAIAIDIAAQAAPDGYTLLALSAQNVAGMVSKPGSVDLAKAFSPVVQMVTLPYLMVITPSLPVNSVKELIALAKVKPLVYASSGAGSVVHLAMELFKAAAGVPKDLNFRCFARSTKLILASVRMTVMVTQTFFARSRS